MDDIVFRPRLPAGLTAFVALKVRCHAGGFLCEPGLAGCIQDPSLNRDSVGKLPLFGQGHGQRFTEVKSLHRRKQEIGRAHV